MPILQREQVPESDRDPDTDDLDGVVRWREGALPRDRPPPTDGAAEVDLRLEIRKDVLDLEVPSCDLIVAGIWAKFADHLVGPPETEGYDMVIDLPQG